MEKKTKTSPAYTVPALDKGLDILEALAQSDSAPTLSQLARQMGRANTEIFRMLNRLELRGYVLRDDAGAYRLSLKLFQLARVVSPLNRLLELAAAPMRQLAVKLGQSCHLGVIEAGELVVIATADPPTRIRLSIAIGSRFDLAQTVSGRALLADLTKSERLALLKSSPAYQKMKSTARQTLLQELEQKPANGCYTAVDESIAGVMDHAITLGGPTVGIHAAIAVPAMLRTRSDKAITSTICRALIDCAAKIESSLGPNKQ
jgi:DNA-binding IclR family transcriptional regulator